MTNKDWLLLAIITFLTAIVWTVFDVYHEITSTTVTPTQTDLVEPIDPTLNTEVFDEINARRD